MRKFLRQLRDPNQHTRKHELFLWLFALSICVAAWLTKIGEPDKKAPEPANIDTIPVPTYHYDTIHLKKI